jgi:hypothetical protein
MLKSHEQNNTKVNRIHVFSRMPRRLRMNPKGCDTPKIYLPSPDTPVCAWHLSRLCHVLDRLKSANLTVNVSTSEFDQAKVMYHGHVEVMVR